MTENSFSRIFFRKLQIIFLTSLLPLLASSHSQNLWWLKIIAHADSPADYFKAPGRPEVLTEINMESAVDPGRSGGFGIDYNGDAPAMIKDMKVEWK